MNPRTKSFLAALAAAAWAGAVVFYVQRGIPWRALLAALDFSRLAFPPSLLLNNFGRLAALAGLGLIFLESGRSFLIFCGARARGGWEEAGLGLALGYGAWATAWFFLGLAGLWRRP
ncbi:MAG: hypothetical protein PHF00_08730, partial [Elusimicrobia bacterium]|nr:hypothetical protein [Elusimicrobiota bacterium]